MSRLRCVIDASVLIDFNSGGVLEYLFQLSVDWIISDFAMEEIKEPAPDALRAMGLQELELSGQEVSKAIQLREDYPNLSVYDIAHLLLALREQAHLITSDQLLRSVAVSKGLRVHGTLWVLDELIRQNLLSEQVAGHALRKMLEARRWLPSAECARRLKRWGVEPP